MFLTESEEFQMKKMRYSPIMNRLIEQLLIQMDWTWKFIQGVLFLVYMLFADIIIIINDSIILYPVNSLMAIGQISLLLWILTLRRLMTRYKKGVFLSSQFERSFFTKYAIKSGKHEKWIEHQIKELLENFHTSNRLK